MEINKFSSIPLLYLWKCFLLGEQAWKNKSCVVSSSFVDCELWKLWRCFLEKGMIQGSTGIIETLGAVIDRILCQWIQELSVGRKTKIMR